MSGDRSGAHVIPFPPQLRLVPVEPSAQASFADPADEDSPALVDHDGHPYELGALLERLAPHHLQEIDSTAPRSGQVLWDEVTRRWPALAAEIAAIVGPAE